MGAGLRDARAVRLKRSHTNSLAVPLPSHRLTKAFRLSALVDFLDAHGLENHPFRSLPIPLSIEHPLPRPKIELPLGNRDDHFVANR